MASLREIKLRIRSVKSTQKITKAMEMVAASKMKKAQTQALKGRPYLTKLAEVIDNLLILSNPPLTHAFLQKRPEVKRIAYVLLTSNRGLCGGFNTTVIKTILEVIKQKKSSAETVVTVGKKGRQAIERIGGEILADFSSLSDKPTLLDTFGISGVLKEDFLKGNFDEVYLVYSHFYSTLQQKPVIKKLLPIEPSVDFSSSSASKFMASNIDYIFEGDKVKLLDELLNRYLNTVVYQTVLESIASEQSARMMAMRKASDNATEIVGNLTLEYNKGRQAKITTQILEIVAGSQS